MIHISDFQDAKTDESISDEVDSLFLSRCQLRVESVALARKYSKVS